MPGAPGSSASPSGERTRKSRGAAPRRRAEWKVSGHSRARGSPGPTEPDRTGPTSSHAREGVRGDASGVPRRPPARGANVSDRPHTRRRKIRNTESLANIRFNVGMMPAEHADWTGASARDRKIAPRARAPRPGFHLAKLVETRRNPKESHARARARPSARKGTRPPAERRAPYLPTARRPLLSSTSPGRAPVDR